MKTLTKNKPPQSEVTNAAGDPVRRYLEKLELEVKKLSAVVPEDALCDAREFLQSERAALQRSEPGIGDEELYDHFIKKFGEPEEVAYGYSDKPDQPKIGQAPHWRICCTRCGRSAPADRLPMFRVGARSVHKYILCYCQGCKRFRWARLIKDLNTPNLTERLGQTTTADELRRSMHRPWTAILCILAVMLPVILGVILLMNLFQGGAVPPQLQTLPPGWKVEKSFEAPAGQRDAIAKRLGVKMSSLHNTVLSRGRKLVQVNVVACPTVEEADKLTKVFRKTKSDPRLVQQRERIVFEIVCQDMRLAMEARNELGIQPRKVTYRLRFDAAPMEQCDYMKWNAMFNLFLKLDAAGPNDQAANDNYGQSKRGSPMAVRPQQHAVRRAGDRDRVTA